MADPWPADGVLAVTKLHIPTRRADLIERTSLVRELCADDARLTLISAPPGAGKTTLLAEWHAAPEESRPFAWLSLDADDGDPVRFWTLVIEALRTVHPGFGEPARAALQSVRGRLIEIIVPLVINEASVLETETVLVLDDLHLVEAPKVHDSLAFLVDRLPEALRLAIATRVDPRLPLERLRVRGELREVRGADLRFSDVEAGVLLHERFGVRLDQPQLTRLQRRTEGWAAALQMAGLSLRRGADPDALETVDTGVLEYLAREVLAEQDEAMRRFLVETSILDRMSAPLCDAVTGGDDAAERLPELDRRNLLVVPLDPGRRWWRYHSLFADVLRAQLDPERAAELHRRALAWHARHGIPGDAIRHALAAGETQQAVDLIAAHWRDAFNRGELATVERWLGALPQGSAVADSRLWLAQLWLLMDHGRLVEAGAVLEDTPLGASGEVQIWGLLLRALHAFKVGDVGAAEDGVARALELDPADRFWRTVAALVRGLAGYAMGRVAAAGAFEEAGRLARADGNRLGLAYALGYRALMAIEAGLPAEAQPRLQALEELRSDPAVSEHFVAFAGGVARAALAEREGRYEAAAEELLRAAEVAERGAGRTELAHVKIALGQVQWARGRREEARALAAQAGDLLGDARDPGRVAGRLARLESRVQARRPAPGGVGAADALSDSELAVLRLLPSSLSNREIGEQLFISVNTVKTHLRSIYAKLGSSSREQAVGRARELGLVDASPRPGSRTSR
jgi:LuxR family maltose regulon positive regulatory protein